MALIGNGVDTVAFGARRRASGAGEGTDVVFVGGLEIAQKGLDLLLDAWARVADRVPGRLVLAGTGPDEQALRESARRLGVVERVHFAGWVAGVDKFRRPGPRSSSTARPSAPGARPPTNRDPELGVAPASPRSGTRLVAATLSDTMLAFREHLVPMCRSAPSNHHSAAGASMGETVWGRERECRAARVGWARR